MLDWIGVHAQMSVCISDLACFWGESLLHATVVMVAGSCEHISLTQKEIRNCAVEQLTSLCAGPAGPQPTHTD